jgi:hypothetical protein
MSDIKLVALRLFNKTRSCVLMRQFKSGLWAFPTSSVPLDEDPMYYVDEILEKDVTGDFELVSAINVFECTRSDLAGGKSINYVYDIKYNGFVYPSPPANSKRFISGKWMAVEQLKREKNITYLMCEFVSIMEKEQCLK